MQKVKILQRFKPARQKIYFVGIVVLLGLVIAACSSTITNIDQPNSVTAGDTAKIILSIQWKLTNFDHNDRQVIGICVPKSWNAGSNTIMKIEGDAGDANMSLIPESAIEPATKLSWSEAFMKKFGVGPNLISDMEWVVFWSDTKFSIPNQSTVAGKVYINIKSSLDNLQFKPGYGMCEDNDGLADNFTGFYTSAFGSCLEVLDGEGDLQDFCNPQIGVGEPSNALANDLITIKYDGNLDISTLSNEQNIYFCAKAYLADGTVVENCNKTDEALLKPWAFKKWRIDLWPFKYFGLQQGQELTRIEYYFTDQSGNLKTGFANTSDPFIYTFKCK